MQKVIPGAINGLIKDVRAQSGGTKGHSKPSTGGTHAGPPPAPQPQSPKK
jgi:hypothetical protein